MKVKIIAEIGINHNGDISLAKKMIEKSKEAGVDIVKFQKRTIDLVYSKDILNSPRQSPWGSTTRDQKEGLELNRDEYDQIDKFSKELGISWFASAWDLESLDFLKKYKSKFNKIASAMIIDLKFLREVAKEKKHTFISTGMSNMEMIQDAVKIFREESCPFELMHCISAYPFNDEIANLNLIPILKKKFDCDIGYSGHEKGGAAISSAATALGITSLERHVTLDRTMYGTDQSASITMDSLKDLVLSVRKIEKAMSGSETKEILEIEKSVAEKLRAHIPKKR